MPEAFSDFFKKILIEYTCKVQGLKIGKIVQKFQFPDMCLSLLYFNKA